MKRVTDYDRYIENGTWKCFESPSGAHHWVGNSSNIFVCKWCRQSRQFGPQSIQLSEHRKNIR